LAGDTGECLPDGDLVGRKRHLHAAKWKCGDHGAVARRQLPDEAFDRISEEKFATAFEGFLIDDQDEATACRDAVVRPVGRRNSESSARGRVRRRRDAPERTHDTSSIADPYFYFRRLQIRGRCSVCLHRGEVNARARRSFARDLRLARRGAFRPIHRESREEHDDRDAAQ
jgi:hypothetical protein